MTAYNTDAKTLKFLKQNWKNFEGGLKTSKIPPITIRSRKASSLVVSKLAILNQSSLKYWSSSSHSMSERSHRAQHAPQLRSLRRGNFDDQRGKDV